MKNPLLVFFSIGLISLCAAESTSYKPKDGYVPDAQTAMLIAQAVWTPIYGKSVIEEERPFSATLSNGVWTVEGTLPKGLHGGVALAEISKDDARILRVAHGR
jgi:hypothetical protein